MDKSKLSKQAKSKLSSYTWMKLPNLPDEQVVNILVRTTEGDAKIFKKQIESLGLKFISSFGNKATLQGTAKDLSLLADLDFIDYIEIGMGLASEKRQV